MPIFGQVWLWSLLAFLLGALLCWVWVVLPVRRRIDSLERRLAGLRTDPRTDPRAESRPLPPVEQPLAVEPEYRRSSPGIVPGLDSQDEIRAESLTRAYALPGLDAPQEPVNEAEERGALHLRDDAPEGATAYFSSRGTPSAQLAPPVPPPGAPESLLVPANERDWFDDVPESRSHGDHHLIDDHEDDHEDLEETGTIFTQRTMPIPAAAIRQLDESKPAHAAPEEPAEPAVEPTVEPYEDESLVDDLAEEDEEPATSYMPPPPVFEPVEPPRPEPMPEPATNLLFTPNGTSSPVEEEEPEPLPVARPQDDRIALVSQASAPAPARSTLTESEPMVTSGITIQPEVAPAALPKRIPSKPQHRVPFGVPTTSTATTTTGERMRSLFEPVVPAEGELTMPPPHRVATDSRPSAPGPFGPGSAMPLPGGASPSPEFTIKASVTALRYCTPESPQFGRTVAEVWFRSAADAERVGFRPVG